MIRCLNPDHVDQIQFVCFNRCCEEQQLYCRQCQNDGLHKSHPKIQYQIHSLDQHIEKVWNECEELVQFLNNQFTSVYEAFLELIQGIKIKYQISKEYIFKLKPKTMNNLFKESLGFKSYKKNIKQQFEEDSLKFQKTIKNCYSELKLEELYYDGSSLIDFQKSQELFQRGYQLYLEGKQYQGAIKLLDEALLLNPKNLQVTLCKAANLKMLEQYPEAIQLADYVLKYDPENSYSLLLKAESLRLLGRYNEAIINADKALQIDPKQCHSLYTKADSLRLLGLYQEAIIMADESLKINQYDYFSLWCKSESLRQINKVQEAMELVNQSLQINANHFDSLRTKAACLQDQKQFQEAMIYYNKALTIKPNHKWTIDKKIQCLQALNQ